MLSQISQKKEQAVQVMIKDPIEEVKNEIESNIKKVEQQQSEETEIKQPQYSANKPPIHNKSATKSKHDSSRKCSKNASFSSISSNCSIIKILNHSDSSQSRNTFQKLKLGNRSNSQNSEYNNKSIENQWYNKSLSELKNKNLQKIIENNSIQKNNFIEDDTFNEIKEQNSQLITQLLLVKHKSQLDDVSEITDKFDENSSLSSDSYEQIAQQAKYPQINKIETFSNSKQEYVNENCFGKQLEEFLQEKNKSILEEGNQDDNADTKEQEEKNVSNQDDTQQLASFSFSIISNKTSDPNLNNHLQSTNPIVQQEINQFLPVPILKNHVKQ